MYLTQATGDNLGDEIALLGMERLASAVDLAWKQGVQHVDKQTPLSSAVPEAIAHGWWSPACWPPPAKRIHWFGLHLAGSVMVRRGLAETLKQHPQPVGCRDLHTLNAVLSAGVSGVFTGCPSLSLHEYTGPRSGTVLVDVDPSLIACELPEPCTTFTHQLQGEVSLAARRELALTMLATYRKAKLVVTGRLHVALPCAAMGTPCWLVSQRQPQRLAGMEQFVNLVPYLETYDSPPMENADRTRAWKPMQRALYALVMGRPQ